MSIARLLDTHLDTYYYAAKGQRLYYQGNYEAAIVQFDLGVSRGELCAMYNRAEMHRSGYGGPVNAPEAINLLENVVNRLQINCPQHYTDIYMVSLNRLACMHENGEACPVNYPKAVELYEKAIALNLPTAMYNRAIMYEKGRDGSVNLVEANRLYLLAHRTLKSNSHLVNPEASKAVLNMAISINTINSCKTMRGQLTSKQEKLLTHGYAQYDIPEIMIGCEKLKDDILKMNVQLFDLLRDEHKSLSEAKKLELINNKVRHSPKTDDIESDLETIDSLLAPSSTPLPQALHCIADNLQCILSYEKSKQFYIEAAKQLLNTLKINLDTMAQDQWTVKWFGKWVKGTPRHIHAMQQALASLDCKDTISLLKTYNIILDTVRSITANKNRHPSVATFYNELSVALSKVVYENSDLCMQLSAVVATTPPAAYGTYGYVTNAFAAAAAAAPAQPIYLGPPPSYYDACQASQPNSATIAPTATSAAAQPAPTASNQYSTQLFYAMFPAAPNHSMPVVNTTQQGVALPCGK